MRAIDRSRSINIRLDADTQLHFRFLTLGDEEFLEFLVREDPEPRDFALRILDHQVQDTSPAEPRTLGDEAVARAAHAWANGDGGLWGSRPTSLKRL